MQTVMIQIGSHKQFVQKSIDPKPTIMIQISSFNSHKQSVQIFFIANCPNNFTVSLSKQFHNLTHDKLSKFFHFIHHAKIF